MLYTQSVFYFLFGVESLPVLAKKSFMKIPKKMRDHGRLNRYRDVENIEEIFEKASKDLENTNNNFK